MKNLIFIKVILLDYLDNEKPLKIGVFPNSEGLKDEKVFFPELK